MFFVNMELTIICKKAVIENSRVLEIFSDQSVTPRFLKTLIMIMISFLRGLMPINNARPKGDKQKKSYVPLIAIPKKCKIGALEKVSIL